MTGARVVYCPGCNQRVLPGQEVAHVDHEDPWQELWHRSCHETRVREAKDVDELAERYRLRLGLRTWSEQEAWVIKEHGISAMGRRGGKTLRAILRALATCSVRGQRTLYFSGNRSAVISDAKHQAREAIARLELDIEVVSGVRIPTGAVVYTDHAEHEMRR